MSNNNLDLIGLLMMNEDNNLRLSSGARWMVYDNTDDCWIVYEHKPYQKKVSVQYRGDLEMALSYMVD